MSPTDLKLLEGILSSLRILCGLYGMPSVLFNDNDSSTYNNVSEAKQTAYSDVYIPLGKKVDKALSQFLNGKLKVNENIVIDVTSIEVLKATTNELAQALSSLSPLLANKVLEAMTENEINNS
jgi:phage portal protein BeeE